jgi:hypothetical protein
MGAKVKSTDDVYRTGFRHFRQQGELRKPAEITAKIVLQTQKSRASPAC